MGGAEGPAATRREPRADWKQLFPLRGDRVIKQAAACLYLKCCY